MEALAPEVAPFGIRTMLVEPGFFRTELLTPAVDEVRRNPPSRTTPTARQPPSRRGRGMDGKQGGDPAKLAGALVQLAALEETPARFAAGADAVGTFEAKAQTLLAQAAAHRDLSSSLAHEDA